jgi:hypothetical protein
MGKDTDFMRHGVVTTATKLMTACYNPMKLALRPVDLRAIKDQHVFYDPKRLHVLEAVARAHGCNMPGKPFWRDALIKLDGEHGGELLGSPNATARKKQATQVVGIMWSLYNKALKSLRRSGKARCPQVCLLMPVLVLNHCLNNSYFKTLVYATLLEGSVLCL